MLMSGLVQFFVVYVAVEAGAMYDRKALVALSGLRVAVVLQTKVVLMVLHVIFALSLYFCLILTAGMHDGVNRRQVWFVGIAIVATTGSTFFMQGYCVITNEWMCTPVPILVQSSTFATFRALALFLFHTSRARVYETIQKQGKGEQSGVVLDLVTDDGDDNEVDFEEDV
jgi:hypothetical protein